MELYQKYTLALEKFCKLELKNKSIEGIFVSGSYVRKSLKPNSDIDIFILHNKDFSQVVAKYVDGIEFECCYKSYEHFLKDLERKHTYDIQRYTNSLILYDPNRKLEEIIKRAKVIYKKGPKGKVSDSDKYHVEDGIRDIEDNLENPATLITMTNTLNQILHIYYKKENLRGVKEKHLLDFLSEHDEKLATMVKGFLAATNLAKRREELKNIKDYVMKDLKPLPLQRKTKKKSL